MNRISKELASRIFQEVLIINKENTNKSLNKLFAEVKDLHIPKKILKNVFKNERKKTKPLTMRIYLMVIRWE